MIFRSAVFSRRDGISQTQFGDHWQRVHGHLARKMPGVHKYLQNHIRERLFEVSPFPDHPVDGISQQWFDDIAAMERCERSREYAEVKKDIPNFQGAITILVLEGVPVVDVPAQGTTKLLVLSRVRQPGLTLNDAMPGLKAAVSPNGDESPRYVQNFVVDRAHPVSANVPQGKVPVEAIGELWFADPDTLHRWVTSDAGVAFLYRHKHLDPIAVYVVEEIRIV